MTNKTTVATIALTLIAGPALADNAGDLWLEGQDYYYGKNGKRVDKKKALALYLRVAKQGHDAAQHSLRWNRCYNRDGSAKTYDSLTCMSQSWR